MNMKHKRRPLIYGVFASLMLATAGVQAKCDMASTGHMYFSFAKQIDLDDSPAEAFESVKAQLRDLAETQKLENFAITSSDMSISAGGYGSRGLSLHISVGAQMAPNVEVIDIFFRETKPDGFSYSEAVCVSYETGGDSEEAASEPESL